MVLFVIETKESLSTAKLIVISPQALAQELLQLVPFLVNISMHIRTIRLQAVKAVRLEKLALILLPRKLALMDSMLMEMVIAKFGLILQEIVLMACSMSRIQERQKNHVKPTNQTVFYKRSVDQLCLILVITQVHLQVSVEYNSFLITLFHFFYLCKLNVSHALQVMNARIQMESPPLLCVHPDSIPLSGK